MNNQPYVSHSNLVKSNLVKSNVVKNNAVKAFALLAGVSMMLGTMEVAAHGYVSNPKSRSLTCRDDGPTKETPVSAACKAALAAGNESINEPQSIAIVGANDNHQALIPDGKLCSANSGRFAGLDLARNDWPATFVSAGPRTFIWTNTAQHKTTYFRYYITKQGFNPLQPLKWSDLEQIHQSGFEDRQAVSTHVVNLPARTGRHIIYSIWQRDKATDAAEGFYQCVDVTYSPNSSASSVSSNSSSSSSSSSSTTGDPCEPLPVWNASTTYNKPQQVKYNNRRYAANYWTLGNIPSETSGEFNFWLDMGQCSVTTSSQSSVNAVSSSSSSSRSAVPSSSSSSSTSASGNCTSPVYVNGTSYATGALAQNIGNEYRCTVAGWCSQSGTPYVPGTGWAWNQAWTLVRSCQ